MRDVNAIAERLCACFYNDIGEWGRLDGEERARWLAVVEQACALIAPEVSMEEAFKARHGKKAFATIAAYVEFRAGWESAVGTIQQTREAARPRAREEGRPASGGVVPPYPPDGGPLLGERKDGYPKPSRASDGTADR